MKATDPKAGARQIPERLQGRVDAWMALPVSHPHRIHALFAELYLCTSLNWLERLEASGQGTFAYTVMTEFWALYERHVPDCLDAPLSEVAPHWRAYHRLARRIGFRAPTSMHLILVSLGVRAHVHLDLGEAVLAAERSLRLTDAEALAVREAFFDGVSEDAFFAATLAFIDRHRARREGWRGWVLTLYRAAFVALRPIWWHELRRWRKSGYELARAAEAGCVDNRRTA